MSPSRLPGFAWLDAEHQAFVGDLDELLRLDADVADQVHAAGVAVPAVEDRGHVDIDDVAVLQRPVAGNAVADDMVDRGAAALRIAAIAQGRGDARRASRHLGEDDVVDLLGGDAGDDMGNERVEDLGGAAPGGAHAGKALRGRAA